MATWMNNRVRNAALEDIANRANQLILMSGDSNVYLTANGAQKLGSVALTPAAGNGSWIIEDDDGVSGKRRLNLAAVSGISITVSGTVTHYGFARSTVGEQDVYVISPLAAGVAVTAGGTHNVNAFTLLRTPDVTLE